jgi:hypothetical protein
MKVKSLTITFLAVFALGGCTVNQAALNYSNSMGSKSDMQICIDNALLGTNDAYYNYISNEIKSRNVDCKIYAEQVATARASNQTTQTVMSTFAIVFGVLFGLASA